MSLPLVAQAAPTITEFSAGSGPVGLAAGADGNVWWVDLPNPGMIGRITPGGSPSTFTSGLTHDGQPTAITAGPGGLWFTLGGKNTIGRITTGGTITQFAGAAADHPAGITAGPDGNLWYVATGHHGAVVRITPTGTTTQFTAGLTSDGAPQSIALGPDGNLWFTEPAKKRIGRITPYGAITEYGAGALAGTPREIAAGPDGNLWFTENGSVPAIGRITPAGVITEYRAGLPVNSAPQGIAAGADGNLYFTDPGANAIGRVTTSGTITTLTAGLTASAGLQGIATGGDGRIWFAEQAASQIGRMSVAPTAGAVVASDVTDTTATVEGTVSPNSEATTYTFEYGTTTAYGQSTVPASAGSGGSAQAVSANLILLSPSTTYHVRLAATNATGTTYGPDQVVTTTAPGAPSATSLSATGVTASDATLEGVVNPENALTTYHFEWDTTTAYSNQIPASDVSVGSDGTDHAVSQLLTDLEPNTTYHFRVVATSPSGTTYGADSMFTTDAVAPLASTSPATGVTGDGVTLGATVNPRNSATAYRFEWGTTTAYGAVVPDVDELVDEDDTGHAVTKALTGLAPNTTYHFRVVATSNAGVTIGADETFTTASLAPDAVTADATGVTDAAATLSGAVNPRNDAATYRFEWGPTTAYGQTSASAGVGAVDLVAHQVTYALGGLEAGTIYHFRLVASSAGGTSYGQDRTFTTAAALPAPPGEARPELGRTAVASVVRGVVRVKLPGGKRYVTLDDPGSVPAGTTVDARRGVLSLVSAVNAAGRTQTARFKGAVFRLGLRASGMVDLFLISGPGRCTPHRSAARAAAKRPPRKLWGKDSKGKYSTHGHNSVATVRGTEWITTETCAGTVTRVVRGSVSVRDRWTGKRRTVRAGHAYLARRRA
ncbi:MAG TPA: hypothetical protein VF250_10380 [Conexibacter sp.]